MQEKHQTKALRGNVFLTLAFVAVLAVATIACGPDIVEVLEFDSDQDGFDARQDGGDDCNDYDPAIYPGAPERCNGEDDDCDGEIDEDFEDSDGDGVADCAETDIDVNVDVDVHNDGGDADSDSDGDGDTGTCSSTLSQCADWDEYAGYPWAPAHDQSGWRGFTLRTGCVCPEASAEDTAFELEGGCWEFLAMSNCDDFYSTWGSEENYASVRGLGRNPVGRCVPICWTAPLPPR
jgi:hypothetical protein